MDEGLHELSRRLKEAQDRCAHIERRAKERDGKIEALAARARQAMTEEERADWQRNVDALRKEMMDDTKEQVALMGELQEVRKLRERLCS